MYLPGDQIPKNVVRGVKLKVPLVLGKNTASPVPFKVQLWKGEYIWLKSDFGITVFVWTVISPLVLSADGGPISMTPCSEQKAHNFCSEG